MKILAGCLILLLVLFAPTMQAQDLDSSRFTFNLGLHRNHYHPFSEVAVGLERVIIPSKLTAVAAIGLNPISSKKWTLPVWRLNWQVSMEFRYYFALRRQRQMSGFLLELILHTIMLAITTGAPTTPISSPNGFPLGRSWATNIVLDHALPGVVASQLDFTQPIPQKYSTISDSGSTTMSQVSDGSTIPF